jgi:hypothetical protein
MIVICSNPAPCALLAQLNNSKNWSAANLTGERAKDHFNSNVKIERIFLSSPIPIAPMDMKRGKDQSVLLIKVI